MKRGIFKRIFILYAAILVLALLFIEFSITGTLRDQRLDSLQQNLAMQASLIADRVSFTPSGQYDELCRQAKAKIGARVTIILRDGTVIGDSDSEAAHMENHAGRPEIRTAMRSQVTGQRPTQCGKMLPHHAISPDPQILFLPRR